MAQLPGEISGARFLRAMGRFGWRVVRQRGSHRILGREGYPGMLLVAFHQTIGRNSVRKVLRLAGIDEEAFLEQL